MAKADAMFHDHDTLPRWRGLAGTNHDTQYSQRHGVCADRQKHTKQRQSSAVDDPSNDPGQLL